jgi:hypothetical protein
MAAPKAVIHPARLCAEEIPSLADARATDGGSWPPMTDEKSHSFAQV